MDAHDTIVITGASRGIGEATARRLAEPGRRLVLLARTEERLAALCRELREKDVCAEYRVADLSSIEAARRTADDLLADVEGVDVLVLNAGMSNDAFFEKTSPDAIRYEASVNYLAPVALLHAFWPTLVERDGDAIFVGSLTALIPFPSNATYAATKAALFAFVRSLRAELEEDEPHVGIVLPGPTRTRMTEDKPTFVPMQEPELVAETIVRCVDRRTGIEIPGFSNRLTARFFQGFPALSERVLNWFKRTLVPGFSKPRRSEAN